MTTLNTAWERVRTALQAEIAGRLPEHVGRLSWSTGQIGSAQREGLHRLLTHATRHSPFHRRRLAGVTGTRITPDDLAELPVMTKAGMMAALDEVFTDRRLNQGLIEQALAVTGAEPVPVLGRYVAHVTGGSSGQRGVFVYDRCAKAGFVLSLMRSIVARLAAAGGPPPGGLTVAMVAASSAVHPTGAVAAETAGTGAALPARIVPVPVTLTWPQIVDRLNSLQAPALAGYPSALAHLAAERLEGRLRARPMVIISTGESLLPEVRAEITAAFDAPVINSFACTEGLVGTSAPGGDVLMFNSDLCITELVDASYRPVEPGAPSAKVLVTNLYNLTQPLIRYELADTFVREPGTPGPGHLHARVQGRSDGVFHYPGGDLHPHVIRSVLLRAPEVADYQVRQTSSGIDVDIIAAGTASPDALRSRLAAALAGAGLSDPRVTVRIAGDLARNPHSGKVQRFVPLGAVSSR